MKNLVFSFLLVIGVFLLCGSALYAQVRDTDITLTVSPENPTPNQEVSARINSYVIDLNKAYIYWSLSTGETGGGIGKKSFSFTAKEAGSSLTLSVTIDTVDGQSVQKNLTLGASSVDLLWEAYDVYAPPFYRGKTLVPSQGKFKIVAIPNVINEDSKINQKNLAYTWKENWDVSVNQSGWGKNYFVLQHSYLDRTNLVEVNVSDISGNMSASGKINLKTAEPKIVFYKNDPVLGPRMEGALQDGFTINKAGESIIAEPYFFSPKDISLPVLKFDWFINGNKVVTPSGEKNVLSVKPDQDASGKASIEVLASNTKALFQEVKKKLSVSF